MSKLDDALKELHRVAEKLKWPEKRLREQEEMLRKRHAGGTDGRPAASVPSTSNQRHGGGGNPGRPATTAPSGGDRRREIDPDYVMAPYRFVDIAGTVLLPPAEVKGRLLDDAPDGLFDKPLENGFSCRLDLEWEAETPLLIGQKDKNGAAVDEPLKLGKDYWIPGASLRGMIRSAAEICGFARLSQVNTHHVYPLRDFNHPYYSDPHNQFGGSAVAVPDRIRAGWLFREQGQNGQPVYKIQPSRLRYIDIDQLLASGCITIKTDREAWLVTKVMAKYAAVGMSKGSGRDQKPDFSAKTFNFRDIGPDSQRREKVLRDEREGRGAPGILVFADAVPRGQERLGPRDSKKQPKNVEYVFLDKPDKALAKPISQEAFERFRLVHTAPGRNQREPVGTWKLLEPLVRAEQPVPVFFVGDLAQTDKPSFAFGLTRMFKIPHRYSVADKLKKLDEHALRRPDANWYQPDMVEALFGYVHELNDYADANGRSNPGDALKSRLAFSGARIKAAAESEPITTVMSAARASFAPFYLKGNIKDWSDAAAELAGRKRYLPRATFAETLTAQEATRTALEAIRARLKRQVEASNDNTKTQTTLKLLHGGTTAKPAPLGFSSRIDAHNVAPEELGLLLFVLTHGGDTEKRYRHMLGRAKPFGAGQLRLVSITLRVDWCSDMARKTMHRPPAETERAGPQREGWLTPASEWSMAPFIDAFCKHAKPGAGDAAKARLLNERPIVEFLATSDPALGAMLNGPDRPSHESNKAPPPCKDNYLRLRYQVSEGNGREKGQNPYLELRRATMPRKDRHVPKDQPGRLLPGDDPRLRPGGGKS